MREKETESGLGTRYMSPLVKQDLARLDKDGESRRSAMNSLKQFVEHLDPGSMPRFLAQVSETRDQGPSRSYAISLYEEVARVHGKLIIPHIPRVMGTVTRSLSSSGSSPQLHQACAKVVSAVARYSVDGGTSAEEADTILRQLCEPLLEVLAGKLEPLAAGAAVCLQALVECDKWKFASEDVVNEACLRNTVALGEKTTRTVAHMQLARSLASSNPSFVNSYGVALLRTGSEVLRQNSSSSTWQQRACAARMLQAVLPTVDIATIASELENTVQALDDCKHDRMAHVRTAVSDALKTAKRLSSNEKQGISLHGCPGDDEYKQMSRPSEERNSSGTGDDLFVSRSKLGSFSVACEEGSAESFFVPMSPRSPTSADASPSIEYFNRSPPFQSKLVSEVSSSQSSSVMSVDDVDKYLNLGQSYEVQAKENVPSLDSGVDVGVPCDSGSSSGSTVCSGQVGKHSRSRSSTPEFKLSHPQSFGVRMGTDQQAKDIGRPPVSCKRRSKKSFNSFEDSFVMNGRKQEGVDLVDDEEILSNVVGTVDVEGKADMDSNPGDILSKQSLGNNRFGKHLGLGFTRKYSDGGILSDQTLNSFDLEQTSLQRISRSIRAHSLDECGRAPSRVVEIPDYDETSKSVCQRETTFNSSLSCEDFSTPQVVGHKPRALITAEDFLPFSTPRRLVRSLQSNLSTSSGASSGRDEDTKTGDGGADHLDMDLETCSEAGWSVRDNPMASDDSFKTNTELMDNEQQGEKACNMMNIYSGIRNSSALSKTDSGFTEECDRISLALLQVAESLLCVNTGKDVESECVKEDITLDNISKPPIVHPQYSLESLRRENGLFGCFDENADSKKEALACGANVFQNGKEDQGKLLTPQQSRDRAVGVFLVRFHHSLSHVFGNSLRSLWACAEAFLGGFLLVVLAIPLAMVLSKILWSRFEHPDLIPT